MTPERIAELRRIAAVYEHRPSHAGLREALDELERLQALFPPTHVVEFGDDGWGLSHPVACRLAGPLFDCPVHVAVAAEAKDHPPLSPGRYVVKLNECGVPLYVLIDDEP